MGIYTTKPVKELDYPELKDLLGEKAILLSPHALDHIVLFQAYFESSHH